MKTKQKTGPRYILLTASPDPHNRHYDGTDMGQFPDEATAIEVISKTFTISSGNLLCKVVADTKTELKVTN
jgi:hypothetical protein